jgi:hypothetical protein
MEVGYRLMRKAAFALALAAAWFVAMFTTNACGTLVLPRTGRYYPAPPSLHGVVTDAHDGRPLEGVVVEIDRFSRTTNARGEYSISLTPNETYHLLARKAGYLTMERDVSILDVDVRLDIMMSPER